MRKLLWTVISVGSMFVLLAGSGSGCGGDDLVIAGNVPPSMAPTTPTVNPTCVQSGFTCTMNTDCCSGSCFSPDGVSLECQ